MSVQTSSTYKDMLELMRTAPYSVYWSIKAALYVGGVELKVADTVSLVTISDYATRYYGDRYITIRVDPVVKRRILANLQDIEIEVSRTQSSTDGTIVRGVQRESQRFLAYVTDATNPDLLGTGGLQAGQGDHIEQLSNLENMTLQLVEPCVSDYRTRETGSVFTLEGGITVKQVLRYCLGMTIPQNATKSLLESNRYLGIRGVDVVEPDNNRRYQHIVIPNTTRLTAIPKFLQENYGVYASGLGWHIERGRCYIYPLMDYTQYQKRPKVLTILNVPVNEAPTMERTFIVKGKEVFVFATGDTSHVDETEQIQQNIGNGLSYSLAGNLLDDMFTVSQNKVTYNKSKNLRSFTLDKRPKGDANIREAELKFTDNPYRETSRVALGLGTRLNLRWDNSDKDLLYPGMPVKVLYKANGEVQSLLGILVGMSNTITTNGGLILDNHYIGTTLLQVHVKRISDV